MRLRSLAAVLSLVFAAGVVTPGMAATQCRDPKGRFVKCPAKPAQCRDDKGRFTKCTAAPAGG